MTCRGCHNRLELPVGTSGSCDPCYLSGKIKQVVATRYPTSKARELTSYLAKVLTTLERDCEVFETDRTAGIVDARGFLIQEKKGSKATEDQEAGNTAKAAAATGVHPGKASPTAGPSTAVKEECNDTGKDRKPTPARSTSKHRRRRRSRSRRREKRQSRGSPSPVVVEEQAEAVSIGPEVEEEYGDEGEEEEDQGGSQDDEVIRNPQKFELRQTAKPSSRKPLPRRPRTPSVSPPGYRERDPAPLKRWKGWAHVYRGQERQSKGKGKGGKGRPSKGKPWHRR